MWSRRRPDEVALRILRTLFAGECPAVGCPGPTLSVARTEPESSSRTYALTSFQEAAVTRLRRTLARRGGAILADAVGLGKTYVALALAEERLRAGGDVVAIVPAALRPVWTAPLRRVGRAAGRTGEWRVLSHTQLSRGADVRKADGSRLIIVDEAHRFRNPATLRYRALARLAADGAGIGPDLLLVTATPVNNTLADLYHLVRLFLPDDGLRTAGIPSVRAVFDTAPPDPAGLRILVRELVVRRSRPMVERRYEAIPGPMRVTRSADRPSPRGGPSCSEISPAGSADHRSSGAGSPERPAAPVRFPRRAAPCIHRYEDPGIRARVAAIEALELTCYGSGAAPLIRLGLLKRMDSSPAAFTASVSRLRAYLDAFVDAAREGRLLRPGHGAGQGDGDPLQLTLLGVVTDPAPPDVDLEALTDCAAADRRIADMLIRGLPQGGGKAEVLLRVLDSLAGERVLVFSEYRDTAASLWRALLGRGRVARIDGAGAWLGPQPAGRRTVVERFAPTANGRRIPPARERVDVLIATDVLAEGLNLQDARHVISYDLPWNPVRLLQRIGRIDRLGSPHDEVVPHLFVPVGGLDAVLGLTSRLRTKLHGISSVLDEPQADDLLQSLAAGRVDRVETTMHAIESADLGDPWERLRTLWFRHRPAGGLAEAPRVWGEIPHLPESGVGKPGTGHDSQRSAPLAGQLLGLVLLTGPLLTGPRLAGSPGPEVQLLEVTGNGAVGPLGDAGANLLARALDGWGSPGTTDEPWRAPSATSDRGHSDLDSVNRGHPPRQLRPLLKAVDRYRTELVTRSRVPTGLGACSPAARLARRVRSAMAGAGAGLGATMVKDGEDVLRALARPLPPALEQAVTRLLDGEPPGGREPTEMVAAAAHALRRTRAGGKRSREPMETGSHSVLAVLLTDRKPG